MNMSFNFTIVSLGDHCSLSENALSMLSKAVLVCHYAFHL